MLQNVTSKTKWLVGGAFAIVLIGIGVINMPDQAKGPSQQVFNTRTICHYTANPNMPYEKMTVNANGFSGHGDHSMDIFDIGDRECPTVARGG